MIHAHDSNCDSLSFWEKRMRWTGFSWMTIKLHAHHRWPKLRQSQEVGLERIEIMSVFKNEPPSVGLKLPLRVPALHLSWHALADWGASLPDRSC
eukprot:4379513-Amphidinium_carterae.1